MRTLIRRIILALTPRSTRVVCNRSTWRAIVGELHKRGKETTEAGCFLLGTISDGRRHVCDAVYYDDLVPDCLEGGGIYMEGPFWSSLWNICRARNLKVVADIHTHPGAAEQSAQDQASPAIAQPGHVAFIVPNFAKGQPDTSRLGIFEYGGNGKWMRFSDHSKYLLLSKWI